MCGAASGQCGAGKRRVWLYERRGASVAVAAPRAPRETLPSTLPGLPSSATVACGVFVHSLFVITEGKVLENFKV